MRIIGIDGKEKEREEARAKEALELGGIGARAKGSVRDVRMTLLDLVGMKSYPVTVRTVTPPGKEGRYVNIDDPELTALHPDDPSYVPVWPYRDMAAFVPLDRWIPTPALLEDMIPVGSPDFLLELRTAALSSRATEENARAVLIDDARSPEIVLEYVIPPDALKLDGDFSWGYEAYDRRKNRFSPRIEDIGNRYPVPALTASDHVAFALGICRMITGNRDLSISDFMRTKDSSGCDAYMYGDGSGLHMGCSVSPRGIGNFPETIGRTSVAKLLRLCPSDFRDIDHHRDHRGYEVYVRSERKTASGIFSIEDHEWRDWRRYGLHFAGRRVSSHIREKAEAFSAEVSGKVAELGRTEGYRSLMQCLMDYSAYVHSPECEAFRETPEGKDSPEQKYVDDLVAEKREGLKKRDSRRRWGKVLRWTVSFLLVAAFVFVCGRFIPGL